MDYLSKDDARKKYLKIRDNITERNIKENKIFEFICNSNFFINAKVIAIYNSFKSEVSTKKLIDYMLEFGKIVCIPKVIGNNMEFYKISSINDINYKNSFGIYEPKDYTFNLIKKSDIDIMIIPGICFDYEGNRVGFGMGYYDKYLSGLSVCKIGICFDEQLLYQNKLLCDHFDVKMDIIITDRTIINLIKKT